MNSNFRFELHKHRNTIAVGAGIAIVLIALIVFAVLFLGGDKEVDFVAPGVDYANYYATIEDNTVILYNDAGVKMDEKRYEKIVYPKHLNDEMVIYADGKFYKISARNHTQTTANSPACILKEEVLLNYEHKSVVEFVLNEQYITVKRENGTVEVYNRETKESYYLENLLPFTEFVVSGNYFVYASDKTINSVNIKTGESTSITVGAETYGFSINNGKVIAFNRFGNGNNLTSIFVLSPSDLKIEALVTESSINVGIVQSNTSHFIKKDSKIVLTEVGVDGKFNSITMNVKSGLAPYSDSNSLIIGNYLYTNKDGSMVIISLSKKLIQKDIAITGQYFCPLFVSAE